MKAIFINATEKTVTEVTVKNDLHAFYEKLQCDVIQTVPLDGEQVLIVDEEGKLKKDSPGHFRFRGSPTIIAGHALVVTDAGEDFGDVRVSTGRVRERVEFLDLAEEERPKPKMVFVPIDDVSPESIAKGRAKAARKLTEELRKK